VFRTFTGEGMALYLRVTSREVSYDVVSYDSFVSEIFNEGPSKVCVLDSKLLSHLHT